MSSLHCQDCCEIRVHGPCVEGRPPVLELLRARGQLEIANVAPDARRGVVRQEVNVEMGVRSVALAAARLGGLRVCELSDCGRSAFANALAIRTCES